MACVVRSGLCCGEQACVVRSGLCREEWLVS